jgi:hypothetical protein
LRPTPAIATPNGLGDKQSCNFGARKWKDRQEVIMAHDPVADDADAAVLDWETGLPPIKHEDLPRIVQQKIAAELTRIRFELSALRKALEGGLHRE